MTLEQQFMLLGLVGGTLGGLASFLSTAFDGFKALPKNAANNSAPVRNERIAFFLARVALGAIMGFVVTFWFIENARRGELGIGKLFFIQCVSGASSTLLIDLSKKASQWFG